MGYDSVYVMPTGNEMSLEAFRKQYDPNGWYIAKATCVRAKIRDGTIFHNASCDGKTFLFIGEDEEGGLFLDEEDITSPIFYFNPNGATKMVTTDVSFPLPWDVYRVHLSLGRLRRSKRKGIVIPEMQVYVKTLTGKTLTLACCPGDTVAVAKCKIHAEEG
ncbi:hypothetical protein THAOC_24220, partial [Thalassiosira oceanica]